MLDDQQFIRLRLLADRLAGIELQERHVGALARRLHRGRHDPEAVIAAAERDEPGAVQRLIGLLVTGHTAFFRHPQHIEAVVEHAAWAVRTRGSARIWSAATATGEEAWSLALALWTALGGIAPAVSILATDIDVEALAVAESGRYPAADLAAIPEHHRRSGLQEDGGIAPSVRGLVRFARLNLIDLAWPVTAPLDAVLCRNVLMYLRPDHRYAILERIASLLAPDGLLLLDPSEHLGPAALFFTPGSAGVYGLRCRTGPQRRSTTGRKT